MPSLAADMQAGTLVEWKVAPGAQVRRGDIVAVVETQKGTIDLEIFMDGLISDIVAPANTKVPAGTVLARLDGPADAAPPGEHVRSSPAARRLAAARGIDLGGVTGTGVGGAVSVADIAATAAHPPDAAPVRRAEINLAAMRQAIGAAMARSKREIPHYYLGETVELTRALAWLERLNGERPVDARLLPEVLLLRATALALTQSPELNGFWEAGAFRPGDGLHLGWAIALCGGGLVAPAIHDADRLTLDQLMAAMGDLLARARRGGLYSSEISDPTITVTSLGDRGAESVLPIICPPQVAMLAFGRIVTRPWVVDGAIGPRPVVAVTLAGDHRASDGHRGGALLAEIDRLLQEPDAL